MLQPVRHSAEKKTHTCSLRRLLLASDVATLTAVTFVMKDSIGSTVSLVTAMMKASQLAFTCFSNSFLLSTCKQNIAEKLHCLYNTAVQLQQLCSRELPQHRWLHIHDLLSSMYSKSSCCSQVHKACVVIKGTK